MPVEYKVGNLCHAAIAGEVNVIAHQCNCFCAMRSGVAKEIAKLFPDAKEADDNTTPGNSFKMGSYSIGKGKNCFGQPFPIYNLYGQYKYGTEKQQTNYNALRSALRGMAFRLYSDRHKVKIGLPKIGAGLGGGDWNEIVKIINEELKAFNVTVYVLRADEIPETECLTLQREANEG